MYVRLFALVSALVAFSPLAAQTADSDVKVSSIGYLPGRVKRASITAAATAFTVKRDADGSVVFTGSASAAKTDPDTNQTSPSRTSPRSPRLASSTSTSLAWAVR